MSIKPEVLDALIAAGCTKEQIVAAVKAAVRADQEVQAERRERARIRKREQRAQNSTEKSTPASSLSSLSSGHRGTTRDTADNEDKISVPEVSPPAPPLPNPTSVPSLRSGTNTPARIREGWPADYQQQFWTRYPSKSAKKAAMKALEKIALASSGPTWAELMAGLERYVRTKPPDWAWAHAASWLNGERWTDEPAEIIPIRRTKGNLSEAAFHGDAIAEQLREWERPGAALPAIGSG